MARLPDETTLGPIEIGSSSRAIATYDTSGYAKGAAAMGEGARDLGAGIMTAGKALGAYAAQQAEAERKIDAARGQVALTTKQLARGNAIARDTDPVGLVARHVNEAAKEVEQVAQSVSDPLLRGNVLRHRDRYVADVAQRAERRRGVLDAEGGMSRAWEAVDALGAEALRSDDPSAMNRAADVFHDYVDTLRAVGWVDDTKAADIKRNWATGIAERALLQAPAADRVTAIAAAKAESKSESGSAEATGAEVPVSAAIPSIDTAQPQASSDLTQLVRMLPAEVRERIDLESQAEVERVTTERRFSRSEYFRTAIEAAVNEGAPLPSAEEIRLDPDLDEPSRARLAQRHQAAVQELESYAWFRAKFEDEKAGPFDLNDADTRKFIDRLYKSRGADEAALYAVVSRIGVVPDAAVATMNGDLASNDSGRVARTIERLERISTEFPALLAARDTTGDLQNAITQYRYEIARGAAPADAVKRIIQTRSPEYEQALDAKNKNSDLNKEIAKVTSLFDLDKSFTGDAVSMAIMYMTYREVAHERLRATGDPALAKAQALDHMKPIAGFGNSEADNAKRNATASVEGWVPTLGERAWYNALASFYLGTSLGAAQLNLAEKERRMVEAGASDEQLLREFYPALLENRPDQRGHREAALKSLRSAPQRHKGILADLARYNAMKGYSSMAEAAVSLIGQVGGSLPTPESGVGVAGKGITWGARFLSGAWRQAGVNAVVNPAVQALAIAGGGQEKYDPWQHAMSVGAGAIVGGAGSAMFGRRLVPGAGEFPSSAPSAHAPEGLPAGAAGETSAVAPKPIAPDGAPKETPASPKLPAEQEPAHAPVGTSGQSGEVTRFDSFELGGGDRASNKMIVQGSSDVHALRDGALQRKPIFEGDLQRIASGIDGAEFVATRVKDAPGLAEKVAAGRPAHTIGDFLGGRISVESPAALKRVRDEIEKAYRVLEIDDKLAKPKGGGYRAVHMQVDLGNGMSAEIQLVPSEIAKVMDSTHGVYDKHKRLNPKDMSIEQLQSYDADMKWIKSVHDAAWAKQEELGWSMSADGKMRNECLFCSILRSSNISLKGDLFACQIRKKN